KAPNPGTDDADVALGGPPVRDSRAEGHLARVDRGAEVDRTVRDDRLTKSAIELVQLAFGDSLRAIAKAHNVQTRLGQKLEVRRGADLVGEAPCKGDMPFDHRAIAVSAVGGQRGPDRQRPGPARHF